MKNFLLVIFLLTMLSSCVSRLDKHGYMFDLSDHDLLQEGVTSKEKLLHIMGSPTIISDLSDNEAWIYFSEKVEHFLFFIPKITERELLVVRFDETGLVKEIKKIDLNDEDKKLQFVTNYTAVESHKAGFFKSIFSNVGQVKPQ